MALGPSELVKRPAYDDYDRHYAEKMWELVPEIYRHEDGIAAKPGQLRALIEILAEQAAIERRNIDRVTADSRIEEADDWAISYIAELFGTRLVNPLNRTARRTDVGHSLRYRRRAGTPRLFELLADDIADWAAVTSEAFQHLFRFPHAYDRKFPMGKVTATPLGGFPDLRRLRIGDVIGGPFEDMAYRPEFRPGRGTRGKYNVQKVNLYCYRKYAFRLKNIDPVMLDNSRLILDPSGRAHVPLFQQGGFDIDECQKPNEWDIRMPISCRRLNAVRYKLPEDQMNSGDEWQAMVGRTFESQAELLDAAAAAGAAENSASGDPDGLVVAALDPDSLKARLLTEAPGSEPAIQISQNGNENLPHRDGNLFLPHEIAGADLSDWAIGATIHPNLDILIDPVRGLARVETPIAAGTAVGIDLIHYGIYFPVGAGTHDRRIRIPTAAAPAIVSPPNPNMAALSDDHIVQTSQTHVPVTAGNVIDVTGDTRLWAENEERPYFRFEPTDGDEHIAISNDLDEPPTLEINGLWIGMQLADAAQEICELRIQGRWKKVILADVTLDPGGDRTTLAGTSPIPHVRLVIEDQIDELVFDRCIIGSISERADEAPVIADDADAEEEGFSIIGCLRICDSILKSHAAEPAIIAHRSDVVMDRCTVIGDVSIGRGEISNCIITGQLNVQDKQGSCLRFSTIRAGDMHPSPYESIVLDDGLAADSFESLRFGDPGFCTLTPACLETVSEGGENDTEMGVFNRALFPIKRVDLLSKIAEFAPVQATVQLIMKT